MYINSPVVPFMPGWQFWIYVQMIPNRRLVPLALQPVLAPFYWLEAQRSALCAPPRNDPLASTLVEQKVRLDIEIMAKILRLKSALNQFFADVTGQPLDVIQRDTDRDFYMTADQAVQYGLIDKVLEPPKK